MNMLDDVIQKKIGELPTNVRKAIEKFDWSTEIMHIGRANSMQIDDIDTLKKETLMVIVGLTSAGDFEKNLVNQLGISRDFAEKLVEDTNEYIFYPLQKLAFKHEDNNPSMEREEDLSHDTITNTMNDHGIELIDEEREYPKNELQDLADSIFKKNREVKLQEPSPKDNPVDAKEPISYTEPIRQEDLEGIQGHRINTSILKEKDSIQFKEEKQGLDVENLNEIKISKEEQLDVSPSKEKQISERGDFLKHIGAN